MAVRAQGIDNPPGSDANCLLGSLDWEIRRRKGLGIGLCSAMRDAARLRAEVPSRSSESLEGSGRCVGRRQTGHGVPGCRPNCSAVGGDGHSLCLSPPTGLVCETGLVRYVGSARRADGTRGIRSHHGDCERGTLSDRPLQHVWLRMVARGARVAPPGWSQLSGYSQVRQTGCRQTGPVSIFTICLGT